jgi:hypothetical protein
MEIANTQFLLFLSSPISLSLSLSLSLSTLKFEECKLQIHNFISLSLPVFLSFATLSVPTMETANTQFHLSLSLPLATLKGSKNGNCKHAISFLSLSLSLFVSHLLHSMFQQSKLQIPNFTSFSLSTLSLPLATLKASDNANCKYPISKHEKAWWW